MYLCEIPGATECGRHRVGSEESNPAPSNPKGATPGSGQFADLRGATRQIEWI